MNDRIDVAAIITRLAELCPRLIFVYEARRKPLAIGIRDQIIAKVGDMITPDELSAALGSYVRSTGYLKAVARGAVRIDLEGNPVGAPTPEQMAGAAKALAARLARKKTRKADAAAAPCSGAGGTVSPRPKRLFGDLKRAALERKAVAS
jgi:sRNA-binding protein